jgi:hypothetical protein
VTSTPIITLAAILLSLPSHSCFAEDEADHHLPHNHIALVAAAAYEEQADGHREHGNVLGLEYVRQVTEHWGWGAALEMEAFGDSLCTGILVGVRILSSDISVCPPPDDEVKKPGIKLPAGSMDTHANFRPYRVIP